MKILNYLFWKHDFYVTIGHKFSRMLYFSIKPTTVGSMKPTTVEIEVGDEPRELNSEATLFAESICKKAESMSLDQLKTSLRNIQVSYFTMN